MREVTYNSEKIEEHLFELVNQFRTENNAGEAGYSESLSSSASAKAYHMVENSGVDAWKAETTPFDRVYSVAVSVSQPKPPMYVATEAAVEESTTRAHLERLVDIGILLRHNINGTTEYSPDPLHTRMQTLRELLDNYDQAGLEQLRAELQNQVEAWRAEYGVESSDELSGEASDIPREWRLVLYRLGIIEEAIKNYSTYSRDATVSN